LLRVGLSGVLLLAGLAKALPSDAPVAKKPAPAKPPSAQDLNFNLLEEPVKEPNPTHADVAQAVAKRRQMLQLHQVLGLTTLGFLAATDIVGQLNLDDKYGGGGDTSHYELLHVGLATATLGLFATVGILGLFAPTPYEKTFHWDTATFHKAFMLLATAGMVTQVILGILMATEQGNVNQRDFATWHQVTGYTTFGAMAVGASVLAF
jgi:hypothetical protein